MTANKNRLYEITKAIIEDPLPYQSVRKATIELIHFFYEVSGFAEDPTAIHPHLQTECGLAIAPDSAAFCIIDCMRTRVFLKAVKQAIEDSLLKSNGKTVRILYAGSGPFATLVTPLTVFFTPEQLQILVIELNPVSTGYLNITIDKLNLHDYIYQVCQEDATRYLIPAGFKPDILLSETMKPGLDKEPQVTIFLNLVPQCPDAVLIPELVEIDAVLTRNRSKYTDHIFPLKKLLGFSKETCMSFFYNKNIPIVFTEGITVVIPDTKEPGVTRMELLTRIIVYKQNVLDLFESGLTLTSKILFFNSIGKLPQTVNIRYHCKQNPGFQYQLCN